METILVTMLLNAALAAAPATDVCAETARHQFDFWIGEWVVTRADDESKLAGHSTIARVDNCAISEHWRGAAGTTGHSLNAYDADGKVWRQFWVASDGLVLRLEGGLAKDGAMMLDGVLGGVRQRVTWTPRADGSVRQHWESSRDGSSWHTDFDGIYRHPAATSGALHEGADANGLSGGA